MSKDDLINFLEWLDGEGVVVTWDKPDETHEETAQNYINHIEP